MNRWANWTLVAGLLGGAGAMALPQTAAAAVNLDIAVQIAPPALPVYEQPVAPAPGYLWTPGYWAWSPAGYYWVPGAWVLPPQPGLLWTPGWWGWTDGYYRWHPGYWATQVGFYGGINYGYGYFGIGYSGGRWQGDRFYYNTAVTRVNVTQVRNVYVDRTVIVHRDDRHVSYNGGVGGVMLRPDARQRSLESQRRFAPTPVQERWRERAQRMPDAHPQPHAMPPAAGMQRPVRPVPSREEILREHDALRGRPAPQGRPYEMREMPGQRWQEAQQHGQQSHRGSRAEQPGLRPGPRGPAPREQARPEHRGDAHRPDRRDEDRR